MIMNKEIKEILRYLRIENGHCSSELSYEETHLLLDYITNLQEENERLKADYGTKAQVERDILKEENKKLKQKCDFYHNEFIEEKIKNCKAREYIKDCGYNRWCYGEAEEDLLEILQGKSDE